MERKLWFKAKQYGWGWYPVTWQGWAVLLLYVSAVLLKSFSVSETLTAQQFSLRFFPSLIALTIFLILICALTGEPARWRWGKDKEEMVDVLDEQGRKTGKVVSRADTYVKGYWSAAADVWVINSKNEILLQLRSPNKPNNPNIWDISAAGRVASGETPLMGAIRELEEEIGVKARESELRHLGIVREATVRENGTFFINLFCSVFVLKKDLDISELKLQESEVAKVKWVPIQELEKMIMQGDPMLCSHPTEYPLLFDFLTN